ncbi:formate dehydrogenase subunit delta [Paracoccus sp. Z118]|uniref:formate dehydrogenase subunit delta n=1 Tax=Paracoccus sp. Z118 TaxID=2851017 RepID=UPI001C2BF4B3|nr:formate dehydrogenase subunit delta [Paracoccus sp. Z118]MBV0892081.1 formate dehydrogenase subunit delta [Paracoccus sp. Z118]
MSDENLIRMANQIAAFFRTQPGGDASAKVAEHLRNFWAPGMRRQLQEIALKDGSGLDAIAVEAASGGLGLPRVTV